MSHPLQDILMKKWSSPEPSSESSSEAKQMNSELPRSSSCHLAVVQTPNAEEESRESIARSTANRKLPVTVLLSERHWFDSFVDEARVELWPRMENLAYYCNVEARVWARVIIQSPSDPYHRIWKTLHVESSPRYRRSWGANYPSSMLPAQPFHIFNAAFGFFPRVFWERELLVQTLNLRGEYERDCPSFSALCKSVGL